jgi:SAM-dependent methyltransferase
VTARDFARRLLLPLRRTRGVLSMRIGRAASLKPLSRRFGYERGTPIDRHYIESFLAAHADDIRGRCLEIGDDCYVRRFGGEKVTQCDVLHVREDANATIVGDLATAGTLPDKAFDCIILVQTLHLIFDMAAALEQVRRALRPRGVALFTVPTMPPIDRGEWGSTWYWGLTELSLRRLLEDVFGPERVSVSSFGNLVAATGFLHGAAVEEVGAARLDVVDPSYPVTVVGRAVA